MPIVIATKVKDANDVLDYVLDLSATTPGPFLESGETISEATWTVPAGITKDSVSKTDTTATIWLSGGTNGSDYIANCKVVTSGARTKEWSVKILVRDN